MPYTRRNNEFDDPDEGFEQSVGLVEGHYALRADEYDGYVDPVEKAQRTAAGAVLTLNSLPPEARTPEALANAEQLSLRAARLASDANVQLILN